MGAEGERIVRRTLEEHKRLFGFVAEVQRHVERSAIERVPEPWAAELGSYLSELKDSLSAHFAFEESSQFWEDLARSFPRAASRISALVSEHDKILESVGKLARQAEEVASGGKEGRASLVAGVQETVARLRRHEAEEDELIQNLYWDDLGSGD